MRDNRSTSNKLVLVNSAGQPLAGQDMPDDATVDYADNTEHETEYEAASPELTHNPRGTLLIFMAVSIACTAAAFATGSYAIWLGRQQAARKALTDVNDLLKTCQTRLRQLETDVQNLPTRA